MLTRNSMVPEAMPSWLLPSRVYELLKWGASTVLPALATFMGTVGEQLNWWHAHDIVVILNGLAVLAGSIMGITQHLSR